MSINQPKPKTSAEFEQLYGVLNKMQRQAVDAIEGPVMVIAGPGTGKTTILTLRIANILKRTDAAPENILALTFTESGAFTMRRKLAEIIGPAAYKVNIHTFHGFAEHIIQLYPDYFPRIIGSSIATEAEQIKIIEKIVSSKRVSMLRPYGDPTYYVKSILHEIHLLKRENVSPAMFEESIGSDAPLTKESATEAEKRQKRDQKNRELAFAYAAYEKALTDQKLYDFDDMLLELIHTMEREQTFKLILQESYHYVLADEHQDANASQNRILELLSDFHESPNLFIVGDDKQAIYRFQGASLENFLYFTQKYPGATVIDLEHNYRSHQGILDASHSLILNNPTIPGRDRTKLVSLQVGQKPIFIDEFETKDDEMGYIAILISRLIAKGEKPEEIAVLYRENKEAQAVSLALRREGIPHRVESDSDILREPDIVKLLMICRAIHNPAESDILGQALLLPELECDPAEAAEAFARASRERKPLHAIIKAGTWAGLKKAYARIVAWSGEAQTLTFPDFLHKLIEETHMISAIVGAPDSLERLSALQTFYDRIVSAAQSKKTFFLKDFIEYIGIIEEHGIQAARGFTAHMGGVRLMTAHRSKGLEFNHVFIVNAVDGAWGNRIKRHMFSIPVIEHARDAGRIEDERRLFYVAMTRARESVNISYALRAGDKETVPCQFVSEIDPKLVSFEKPEAVEETSKFMHKMQPAGVRIDPADLDKPGAASAAAQTGSVHTSILNPEFVRSKFLSQPFSVTHLNNYLRCPWEYFFVNLIRVPQAPSKHQMYGTAVHAALRSFFDAYKDGRDLTKKQLIDLFKHHLARQPLSEDDRRESFAKGKKALEGYYTQYAGTWGRALVTEYAVKGTEVALGDRARLQLTGKLDKVEYIGSNQAIVTDFKTAKPKSRNEIEGKTKGADGNYKRQLVFYKLLLEGNAKAAMRYGEIDFIEPMESGSYKKERFEVSDKEVADLKALIEKTGAEIVGLGFINSNCGEKGCIYCSLGKLVRCTTPKK